MDITPVKYGTGDATYQAVGGDEGLRHLVDEFYNVMEELPEAQNILKMHPEDLMLSRDKLYCFLSGWMGGPRLYAEKYGTIMIPRAHKHLIVGGSERDMWLKCMSTALVKLSYPEEFREYLMTQLAVPAERIRKVASEST
ncbi:MAG: group II truncated hemoglobin [Lentisphaeraceae bacterium]|nr:group II truncated hemoglobin [Lentisphaeraceae bacterium]